VLKCQVVSVTKSDAVHVANPNKCLQRGQQRLYGHVAAAGGDHQYMIHFDNGIQHECASNTLVVEAANASLPPSLLTMEEGREDKQRKKMFSEQSLLSGFSSNCCSWIGR